MDLESKCFIVHYFPKSCRRFRFQLRFYVVGTDSCRRIYMATVLVSKKASSYSLLILKMASLTTSWRLELRARLFQSLFPSIKCFRQRWLRRRLSLSDVIGVGSRILNSSVVFPVIESDHTMSE